MQGTKQGRSWNTVLFRSQSNQCISAFITLWQGSIEMDRDAQELGYTEVWSPEFPYTLLILSAKKENRILEMEVPAYSSMDRTLCKRLRSISHAFTDNILWFQFCGTCLNPSFSLPSIPFSTNPSSYSPPFTHAIYSWIMWYTTVVIVSYEHYSPRLGYGSSRSVLSANQNIRPSYYLSIYIYQPILKILINVDICAVSAWSTSAYISV